jgi:hypothetical protein
MPLPPKDPKQAFDEIVRRREAELAAQKAKRVADIEQAAQTMKAQQEAYMTEQQSARQRNDEREEWRQGKHAERQEEEQLRRKREVEKQVEAGRLKKAAEEKQKRDEQLAQLHRHAIEKRAQEKIEGARVEEDRRKRDATNYEERALSGLGSDEERRIEHLQREAAKRKRDLQAEAQRRQAEAEEAYKTAKKEAEARSSGLLTGAETEQEKRDIRLEESRAVSRAQAERKRMLFNLDESLAQKLFDIDTETKRLVDEVKRDFATRKEMANRDAERKRTDAAAQRERVEDWFGRTTEKKKDSKDPLS